MSQIWSTKMQTKKLTKLTQTTRYAKFDPRPWHCFLVLLPIMLKLSSVTAASAQPPIMGINDKYTPAGNDSPKMRLETSTLKAGSALLIMCVNETATFDMLTVAATCPIVCATATYQKFTHWEPNKTNKLWSKLHTNKDISQQNHSDHLKETNYAVLKPIKKTKSNHFHFIKQHQSNISSTLSNASN